MNNRSIQTLRSNPRLNLATHMLIPVICLFVALPVVAQSTLQLTVVKHLTTSRDFTLKVAEAMPAQITVSN